MEVIFLIRQLMDRYREQKDLHMVFIDLEKAYDKVPRNVMWWALEKHKVPTKYITLIKDMYKDATTFVRTCDGNTTDFPINIGKINNTKGTNSFFLHHAAVERTSGSLASQGPNRAPLHQGVS